MMKDKHDRALSILAKYHAEGDADDEFVQLEYAEIRAAIELDKAAGQTQWVDFLKTKGNRKRIGIITAIGFFSQWSGNGLISYYLHQVMDNIGITDAQTQLGINAGLKSQALLENIGLSFFIDKFGRRPIYIVSTVGTLITFNIWTIISARYAIAPAKGLGYGFVFMIFAYGWFYDFKYVPLPPLPLYLLPNSDRTDIVRFRSGLMANYTTEILPYGLRAKGFTWLNFCVCAALFFNQYINAIALDALAWKYYLFYCVFLVFEVVIVYFFIVETRYTPMEEIARFFDGDDAVDVAEVAIAEVIKGKGDGGDDGDGVTEVRHVEVTDEKR